MNYSFVQSPSTFPIASRQIFLHPIADVTFKNKSEAYPRVADAIQIIASRYPTDRILVHTVSYELSEFIVRAIGPERAISYATAADRQSALDRYRKVGASILVASSFDRGIDLPGDDCRAIVVCKVPYPSLGDKQINARLHSRGGQLWYSVQTCRSLIQMTGRGMRSIDDHCDSYIIDRQFVSNVWKKNRNLLPKWWTEALVWDAGKLERKINA